MGEKQEASSSNFAIKKPKRNYEETVDSIDFAGYSCYRTLHEKVNSMQLMDLHTHLIGMGNADFWVVRIMETYLTNCDPNLNPQKKQKSKESQLYDLMKCELTTENYKRFKNNFENSLKNDSITVVEKDEKVEKENQVSKSQFWDLFTTDVVYGEKNLFDAFEIGRSLGVIERELTLTGIFSSASAELSINSVFAEHIVFNARKGQFFLVKRAMTNTKLVSMMNAPNNRGESIRALVRNAFSMLNSDGSHITDPAANINVEAKYRNQFTSEFDRRFILRDCIYQQRLEVLSMLLNVVCSRYAKAGIKYVEFSLGFNDCTNENVWKHLADQVFTDKDREELEFELVLNSYLRTGRRKAIKLIVQMKMLQIKFSQIEIEKNENSNWY